MKRKKRFWIVIVIGLLILALACSARFVVKRYLNQIGRTYEDPIETIAPEDEFFEVDVIPEASETPTQTEAPQVSEEPQVTVSPEPGTEPVPEPEPSQSTQQEEDPDKSDSNVIDPDDVEWGFIERIEDDHLINILLIGQDGWEETGRKRTDTMILCSINPETGEVALISFLRDLYVQIPGGYSDNRLNVPYVFGGFDLLNETLENNFGISIDANVRLNFQGFEEIVDRLGGLDVNLSAKEVEYIERVWGLDVEEGLNHFEGKWALNYVRMRKIDSDFGRTARQRTAILTLFNKIKSLPISDLLDLMYDVLPYLTTDLTDGEIISLAYRLLPLVSGMDIETHSVPSKGTYKSVSIRGMAVLLPDREKIRDLLEDEYLPLK